MNNSKLLLEQKIDTLLNEALRAKSKKDYNRLINEYKYLVNKVDTYKAKGYI